MIELIEWMKIRNRSGMPKAGMLRLRPTKSSAKRGELLHNVSIEEEGVVLLVNMSSSVTARHIFRQLSRGTYLSAPQTHTKKFYNREHPKHHHTR